MRIFSAFAALVTAAVLSLTLVLSAVPANSAPAASASGQSSLVNTAAGAPTYGAWICWYMPYLRPLCR